MRWLLDHRRAVVLGALALVTAGSVLAVGAVPPDVLLVCGAISLLVAVGSTFLEQPRCSPLPVALLLGLAAYSALQAVPLPIGWLRVLSPAAADVWSRALLPLGETVSTGTLSLDPGASVSEALKWASYAGL